MCTASVNRNLKTPFRQLEMILVKIHEKWYTANIIEVIWAIYVFGKLGSLESYRLIFLLVFVASYSDYWNRRHDIWVTLRADP